ncbi:hypothetical protein BRL71_15635 [Xanthomonas oryzae pv. oryzae]|nr:hypothetical protein BRL71_15635 [Xanthomonas oryzae pv. oryzae]
MPCGDDDLARVCQSRLPTPDSRLPTPDSRLPTPDSRLPTPDSRLPTPKSRPSDDHQNARSAMP